MKIDLSKADVEKLEDALHIYEWIHSATGILKPRLKRHISTLRAKLEGRI